MSSVVQSWANCLLAAALYLKQWQCHQYFHPTLSNNKLVLHGRITPAIHSTCLKISLPGLYIAFQVHFFLFGGSLYLVLWINIPDRYIPIQIFPVWWQYTVCYLKKKRKPSLWGSSESWSDVWLMNLRFKNYGRSRRGRGGNFSSVHKCFLTRSAVWSISLLNLVTFMGLMNVNQPIIQCLNRSKREQTTSPVII